MDHKRQTFRVLRITNNVGEYPDCEDDTRMYSHLVEYVEDEMELFVYCLETGDFWKSSEFFLSTKVNSFYIPDGL